MSDWQINFPVQDRSDSLGLLGDVVHKDVERGQLADTEAPVVREIGMRLLLDGCETFGAALDRLEALGAAGQRRWLDDAREAVGLASATEVDRRREDARFESAWSRLQPPAPEPWSELQRCHGPQLRSLPDPERPDRPGRS